MGIQAYCDVCNMFRQRADGSSGITRYTLRRDTRTDRGTSSQHAYGSIDLCDECHARIAAPRMNPNKRRKTQRLALVIDR